MRVFRSFRIKRIADPSRRGSLAGAIVMFAALVVGVVKVFHRNPSLLSWRACIELAAVLALSFALGVLAKLVARALIRRREMRPDVVVEAAVVQTALVADMPATSPLPRE